MKTSIALVAALGAAAVLGSTSAHARGADVQWSVSIGAAPVAVTIGNAAPYYGAPVVAPAPVVVAPVVAPAPFVVGAPVYAPRVIYVPTYSARPVHYHRRTPWDVDGDGIPNRYDRVYNPRWDRDGDGIPNRWDRHDDRRRHY